MAVFNPAAETVKNPGNSHNFNPTMDGSGSIPRWWTSNACFVKHAQPVNNLFFSCTESRFIFFSPPPFFSNYELLSKKFVSTNIYIYIYIDEYTLYTLFYLFIFFNSIINYPREAKVTSKIETRSREFHKFGNEAAKIDQITRINKLISNYFIHFYTFDVT